MYGQQCDGGQRDIAIGQARQDDRKTPRRAGGGDAAVRRRLGQMQHVGAVREERRIALGEIQPSRVQFREQAEQFCGRAAFACNDARGLVEQIAVGEQGRCCCGMLLS